MVIRKSQPQIVRVHLSVVENLYESYAPILTYESLSWIFSAGLSIIKF